jgi:hypothetical protein
MFIEKKPVILGKETSIFRSWTLRSWSVPQPTANRSLLSGNPSMKNISHLHTGFLRRRAFSLVSAFVLLSPAALVAQQYLQKNPVSNLGGQGATTIDPDLVDPWGIARGTTTPWWVNDRAAGVATIYNGTTGVKSSLTVIIPHTPQSAIGSPTGLVFNGSNDFAVAPGMPALFLFVSLDGTISGWNPALMSELTQGGDQ